MTEEMINEQSIEKQEQLSKAAEDQQGEEEQEVKDRYLRLMAEFDNFKKRTQKERAQLYVNAAAEVVEAMLPFVDNLERASAVEVTSDEAKTVLEGVQMIARQFELMLEGLGVTVIEAIGQTFDPQLHNAVMHVEDDSVEGEGIIVEEFSKGYRYKDKVIRHSVVKVAN